MCSRKTQIYAKKSSSYIVCGSYDDKTDLSERKMYRSGSFRTFSTAVFVLITNESGDRIIFCQIRAYTPSVLLCITEKIQELFVYFEIEQIFKYIKDIDETLGTLYNKIQRKMIPLLIADKGGSRILRRRGRQPSGGGANI